MVIYLAVTVMMGASVPNFTAAVAETGQSPSPAVETFEIDAFTYRVSIRLPDGTEGLLVRARFIVTYLYEHHQPTVTEHYMSASVGFYYGETVLGRAVLQNITCNSIAFYPKWHDSTGRLRDLYMTTHMFMLNDSVRNGQLVGEMLLMDPESASRYISDFGGTLVINGLTFVLSDGTEVVVTEGTIEIALEKSYNDYAPAPAVLGGSSNLTYSADRSMMIVVSSGSASTPFIVVLDSFIAVAVAGAAGTLLILMVLHLTGHIRLPFGKFKTHILRQTGPRRKEQSAR